jgi:5-methylthioadenosine/S-adenosylhomocysteine deaminase
MADSTKRTLIRGGRVYDHDGDPHDPAVADVLIEGDRIAKVEPGLADRLDPASLGRTIDARDKLVLPGFVNGHYHSHDTLLKGCFETLPLETWVLSALPPAYPKRSKEEVRARTLLGAAECLLSGMTTVQDMLTIFPFDPEHVDVVLAAYEEIGIRVVFALQIGDMPGLERVPYWKETIPPEYHRYLSAAVEPFGKTSPLEVVSGEYLRSRQPGTRLSWALAPTSPEFCSPALLGGLAELSGRHDLPVYTHIYESKSMALAGRKSLGEYGGSQVRYLKACGLLNPKLTLAHSVWMLPEEIDLIAAAGTNVVVNPVGNLKTRSGVPPIREYLEAGVNLGVGCDNCSCSDAQNMFQAMKLFCCLPAVCHPEPGPPSASDALRAATLGGARSAGLGAEIGAVKPGMKADLSILDLRHLTFVPLNSVARQVVYTEAGASVDTVLVDGRVVVEGRRLATIDQDELRQSVEIVMRDLRKDIATVEQRIAKLYPFLMEAWRKSWADDIGVQRYIGEFPGVQARQ